MHKPASAEHGVNFELATIVDELRAEPPYVREGQTARTLIRAEDLRVILVALQEGKSLSEHQANVTAAVQVLSGHVRLQLPDRAVEVGPGQLLVLGAGLAHDVHAHTDAALLLTLGWRERS